METNTSPSAPGSGETPTGTDPTVETTTTSGNGETPGTTTEPSPADIRKENERLANALKRANAEAKEHREARQELQKFKEQIENEKLSEKERLEKLLAKEQKERADFILRTQDRLVSSELRAQAARLGFADPSDAVAMLKRAELEFDDDGIPTNAESLLKEMLKAKPYLAGKSAPTAQTAGGATSPARSQTTAGGSEITAGYVADVMSGKIPWRELSPEQKNAVLQWQAKNPYRF